MADLLVSTQDQTRLLTLDRHAKRNALTNGLIRALLDELAVADRDDAIRCVVITGNGSAFCAGADLEESRNAPDPEAVLAERNALLVDLLLAPQRMTTPVIAAVNGGAIGGGAGLALSCDLVVASPAARFGYPEVKHGITAALLIPNLIRQVGPKIAFELIGTGEPIGADRALALNLINQLVPADELLPAALALAARLAAFPAAAMQTSKRVFHAAFDMTQGDAVMANRDVNTALRQQAPGH
ncbi:enoyl-CoA hydratase [Pigmentiphaga litoralis]|uniref:enoyl-CoA hydratase/isomerase family protein n=1 Tax=Pigmentiphaga litoralis TaxID=516702 RepID=UPI001673C39E|nr:enoyl-CoA hydratase/isomerase family protein [Pigmentiphaga litoralis]GGX34184.1 enoyl-CoA hydratase [Pigmentiphaga litoralis]